MDSSRAPRNVEDPKVASALESVACLGWGSLIWDPRELPQAHPFLDDGPELPIEFSRVSVDGRVTLVIDANAPLVRTFWARLEVAGLDEAVEALGARERIDPQRRSEWVGRHRRGEGASSGRFFEDIDVWLEERSLDAVVWTALPSRMPEGQLETPSVEVLLEHLRSLSGDALERAEQYVRRAPVSVRTPYRARIEADLGWRARSSG